MRQKSSYLYNRLRTRGSSLYRTPVSTNRITFEWFGGRTFDSFPIRFKVLEYCVGLIDVPDTLEWFDDLGYFIFEELGFDAYKGCTGKMLGKTYKAILQIETIKYPDTMDSYHEYDCNVKLFKVYRVK